MENPALCTGALCTLLHQARVDLLEETRHSTENCRFNLDHGLRDCFNYGDVGQRAAAENQHIVQRAAIDVRQGEKRNGQVRTWIKYEFAAGVADIRAEIRVRQHNALGLACSARRIDDGCKLAGKHLGSAQAVSGNLRGTGSGDQCFVTQKFRGTIVARIGNDDLLQPF